MSALNHLYDFLGVTASVRRGRGPQAEEVGSQAAILAWVEAALASDPCLGDRDIATRPIRVDVFGNVVEISGYAGSEMEVRRTVEIVSEIYPVWAWSETALPLPGGTRRGTSVSPERLYRIRFFRGTPAGLAGFRNDQK